MSLVLASSSETRRALLSKAGLQFEVRNPEVDERALERSLLASGTRPEEVAVALAMAKAVAVSKRSPSDLVIGADQTLDLDGERLNKPADLEGARRQLLQLSGRTHRLHSAVAVAHDATIVWSHSDVAALTMRPLDPAAIGAYLERVGPAALTSVGGYQLEGLGIQLFASIKGDFFTILGLPLLPLLSFLRERSVL